MTNPSEQNGHSRMDRMERLMDRLVQDHATFDEQHRKLLDGHERFQHEHRQLLTAQVLLTDHVERLTSRVDKLADGVDRLDARVDNHAERDAVHDQKMAEFDERLNALIAMMDDWIRRQPPPQLN